jgi:hypothetical protein
MASRMTLVVWWDNITKAAIDIKMYPVALVD